MRSRARNSKGKSPWLNQLNLSTVFRLSRRPHRPVERLRCVFCERLIHALDAEMIGANLRIVCVGCGHDLITVEKGQP